MKKQFIIYIGIAFILLIGGIFAWKGTVKAPIDDGVIPIPTQPTMPTEPTPPTPTQPTNPIEPTPPIQPIPNTPQGWKTYRNEELGFELAYPGKWFVYDLARFREDNQNDACYPLGEWGIENHAVFSKIALGPCIILVEGSQIGELRISSFVGERKEMLDYEDPKFKKEIIKINGVNAVKFSTIENGESPSSENTTSININYKGKYYNIFLKQTDSNGNYDPILDEIIKTFRFLR